MQKRRENDTSRMPKGHRDERKRNEESGRGGGRLLSRSGRLDFFLGLDRANHEHRQPGRRDPWIRRVERRGVGARRVPGEPELHHGHAYPLEDPAARAGHGEGAERVDQAGPEDAEGEGARRVELRNPREELQGHDVQEVQRSSDKINLFNSFFWK